MDEITLGNITLTRYFMLYLEEYETAVMADFHLGYEDVMAQKGLFLPKLQYGYIVNIVNTVLEKYSPKRFIINGDLKHEFSRNMPQEWGEIEDMLNLLTEHTEVVIIRGNHDNFLRSILRKRGLKLHEKYTLGKFVFVHGHRDIDIPGDKVLIIAHEHPSVTLRDEVLATLKLPCFLYSPRIIVLPALSLYALGTDITKNEFISPLLTKNPAKFEVYGIDEKRGLFYLGSMNALLHNL